VDPTTPWRPNRYHGLLRQFASGIKGHERLIFLRSYSHSPYRLSGLWYFHHLLSISRIRKAYIKMDMLRSLLTMTIAIHSRKCHSSSLKPLCRFGPSGRSFLRYLQNICSRCVRQLIRYFSCLNHDFIVVSVYLVCVFCQLPPPLIHSSVVRVHNKSGSDSSDLSDCQLISARESRRPCYILCQTLDHHPFYLT
jgi:hypothetical protein